MGVVDFAAVVNKSAPASASVGVTEAGRDLYPLRCEWRNLLNSIGDLDFDSLSPVGSSKPFRRAGRRAALGFPHVFHGNRDIR